MCKSICHLFLLYFSSRSPRSCGIAASRSLLLSFYPKSYLKAVFGCHFSAFRLNLVDSFITKIPLSPFYYMILYQNLKRSYYICSLTAVFSRPVGSCSAFGLCGNLARSARRLPPSHLRVIYEPSPKGERFFKT